MNKIVARIVKMKVFAVLALFLFAAFSTLNYIGSDK